MTVAANELDRIRELPTVIEVIPPCSRGVHESVLRSYQILERVKEMLRRGDSIKSVREFIEWAES